MSVYRCCWKGPSSSIFVLKKQDVDFMCRFISAEEKEYFCVHKYNNGYLVSFKMTETWTLCALMLEDAKVFHQKFY